MITSKSESEAAGMCNQKRVLQDLKIRWYLTSFCFWSGVTAARRNFVSGRSLGSDWRHFEASSTNLVASSLAYCPSNDESINSNTFFPLIRSNAWNCNNHLNNYGTVKIMLAIIWFNHLQLVCVCVCVCMCVCVCLCICKHNPNTDINKYQWVFSKLFNASN